MMTQRLLSTALFLYALSIPRISRSQLIYSAVYQGPYMEYGTCIAPTADNGNIACGITLDAMGQWDSYIIKLAASGAEEWKLTLGIGGLNDQLHDVIETQSGDFVAIGMTNTFSGSTRETWLVRLDPLGTILWSIRYPLASTEEWGYGVVELPSGELLAMANYSYYAHLTKLTSSGSVIWSKQYGTTAPDVLVLEDIAELFNGNYILAGGATESNPNGAQERGVLIEMDTAGVVQWWKEYGNADVVRFFGVEQVGTSGANQHGDLVVTGVRIANTVIWHDSMLVARMSETGDLHWAKVIPDARGFDVADGAPGSEAVLVAGAMYDATDSSALVLGVDESGTVQWSQSVSVPGSNLMERAERICKNIDGTYTTGGTALFPGNGWGYQGAHIVRFADPALPSDCWVPTSLALVPIALPEILPSYSVTNVALSGLVSPMVTGTTLPLPDVFCATWLGVEAPRDEMELVARPTVANDQITLSYTGAGKPLEVRVHDALGRSVSTFKKVGSSEISVDVSCFASGTYTAVLYWTTGPRAVRFVVAH